MRTRLLMILTLTLLGMPRVVSSAQSGTTYCDRLCKDSVPVRSIVKMYGLTTEGEALLRALRRQENGSPGNECGHDNPRSHRQPYGTVCLPDGAEGYARGWLVINEAMQNYILKDPERRREFIRLFAGWFHNCGLADTENECKKANDDYATSLGSLFRQERAFLLDRRKNGGWQWTATATGETW